ncbi:unnamed protein product [Rodentolepis nana]|uniref:Uncharacterized protein n=1 Tax=Rodentolepis nana TaxID=102285 RepID=A0A0R3TXH5_RODNA|nr:unnamed protein product [Rodentolepis nana]
MMYRMQPTMAELLVPSPAAESAAKLRFHQDHALWCSKPEMSI